jgi:hypothetical protein
MEWLNVNKVAAEKEQHRNATNDKSEVVPHVMNSGVEA